MDCKSTHFFVKYTTTLKKIDFQHICLLRVTGMLILQVWLTKFEGETFQSQTPLRQKTCPEKFRRLKPDQETFPVRNIHSVDKKLLRLQS